MRKTLLVVVALIAASVAFAAAAQFQALNAKTGLWQITQTVTWAGLPGARPQTRNYNSCVTPQDLNTNPWANGSNDNCSWTVLNSTSTDMEVQGTGCNFGTNNGMTAQIHGQIHIVNSENGTGTMTVNLTGNGQTMNGQASYTGKWISASCPAGQM